MSGWRYQSVSIPFSFVRLCEALVSNTPGLELIGRESGELSHKKWIKGAVTEIKSYLKPLR